MNCKRLSYATTKTNVVQTLNKMLGNVLFACVYVGDFGIQHGETLFNLIQSLDKIEGIYRYRISSIEPNLLTDEIIRFIAESEKFLPHFHIPLQSGSDITLKAMCRRYQTDLFAERINTIKSILPDAGKTGLDGKLSAIFRDSFFAMFAEAL